MNPFGMEAGLLGQGVKILRAGQMGEEIQLGCRCHDRHGGEGEGHFMETLYGFWGIFFHDFHLFINPVAEAVDRSLPRPSTSREWAKATALFFWVRKPSQ